MKALISWSSGKDSAWALHKIRLDPTIEPVALLTTFNSHFDRAAMHGTRRELVEAQAIATDLPLWNVPLPWPCPNEDYERMMAETCRRAVSQGIEAIVFGDLFLEDVRQYRIDRLRDTGLIPLFPLWGQPTPTLIREMIAGGLRARIVCLDPKRMPRECAGRDLDEDLLAALPEEVDPCGENGEFHTFTYAGPMFAHPIAIRSGEIVERDGFVFADVLSA